MALTLESNFVGAGPDFGFLLCLTFKLIRPKLIQFWKDEPHPFNHIYIYIHRERERYIYIYREREREGESERESQRERERERERDILKIAKDIPSKSHLFFA